MTALLGVIIQSKFDLIKHKSNKLFDFCCYCCSCLVVVFCSVLNSVAVEYLLRIVTGTMLA